MDKLTFHKKHEIYQVILYSFILGLISYISYYHLINILSKWGYILSFAFEESINNGILKLNFSEIVNVTELSILIGLVSSLIINKGYIYIFFRKIKFTKKNSSDDVWLSSMTKGWNPYVEITDFKNNRTYVGWVSDFSEYVEHKEILLRDVQIFEQKSNSYICKTPAIYLNLKEDFIIEFIAVPYYDEPQDIERSENNDYSEQATAEAAATSTTSAAGTNNNI